MASRGRRYFCTVADDCDYETNKLITEEILCHLYESHNINFLDHITLSCCDKQKLGIEKFCKIEFYWGASYRSIKKWQKKYKEASIQDAINRRLPQLQEIENQEQKKPNLNHGKFDHEGNETLNPNSCKLEREEPHELVVGNI